MYVLVENSQVIEYPLSLNQWRLGHPQTSLPETPTEDQLNEVGIFTVQLTDKPVVDYTKDIVEENPELIGSLWTQVWIVVDATPEEISERQVQIINSNRNLAITFLNETDWTQLPDVGLLNKNDFSVYRENLRQIAISPTLDPVWPIKPTEQWN